MFVGKKKSEPYIVSVWQHKIAEIQAEKQIAMIQEGSFSSLSTDQSVNHKHWFLCCPKLIAIYGSGYKCSCMLCHAWHINPSAVIFLAFDGLYTPTELKKRYLDVFGLLRCDFSSLGTCLMLENQFKMTNKKVKNKI